MKLKHNRTNKYWWLISLLIGLTACGSTNEPQVHRQFTSSFEQIDDFKNFYIAPAEAYASFQELTTEKVYDGTYAHKAEIVKATEVKKEAKAPKTTKAKKETATTKKETKTNKTK